MPWRWIAGLLLALPSMASADGGARMLRPDGSPVALAAYFGRPLVLFYEDRGSTAVNAHVKTALAEHGERAGLRDAVRVLPVANVAAYDFAPARGFVLAFLRRLEARLGVPVLADFEGALTRAPWSLPADGASVLLVDPGGRPAFLRSGRLSDGDLEALIARLATLLDGRTARR